MLTRSFPLLDPARISLDLSQRLHIVADDCERLRLDRGVPARLLKKAPLLKDWVPVSAPEGLCLIGYATGHPVHGDCMVMTTPLWWADPDGKWARSLSPFYRLGSPGNGEDVCRMFDSRRFDGPEDEA
ncbi:hypothetical protein QIH77_02235 [Bradyrhizobium diazoefficiens]|uniref:DUF6634 family protein n=1 Tax=Bradyrhizobium diazoefficiens TaxID=1355477 RepID=UPI00272BE120|nr:DUF6634 family protein [Bradyrhizobium diazoefficiens]WLA74077.1 hypothetical protein QIH77_02235 [Bradyrhizobium diazoefficiens]